MALMRPVANCDFNHNFEHGNATTAKATGRPYVPAFSLSGTVPAFTCDCLRFVCAFTRRRKFNRLDGAHLIYYKYTQLR